MALYVGLTTLPMKKLFLITFLALSANILNAQLTKLHDFTGNPDGSNVIGSLFSDGTFLYGATNGGGTSADGTLYKIKPDGTGYLKIYNFTGSSGSQSNGALISDGTFLYGMTMIDGPLGFGVIFKVKPDGTGYVKLHDFTDNPDGADPYYGALYSDGTFLYGMTGIGGVNSVGTIFKIKPDGTGYVTLYSFSGTASDGSNPHGSLISDGTFLYGMTSTGGANNLGTIFKIKPDGTGYVNLLSFAGSANGATPEGSLISVGSFFYGMTRYGGTNNMGVIFKIKSDGTGYGKLLDFAGTTNGSNPFQDLISDGVYLYGAGYAGGSSNLGVLFKIKPDGSGYSKLHDFTNNPDGGHPYSSLIYNGGSLYGTTQMGGTSNLGIAFKYYTFAIDSVKATTVSCNNGANGTASVFASGGLASYSYLWNSSPFQTTQTATGLTAGNYSVVVADANGITATTTITVSQPNALNIIITPVKASCDHTGSASAAVSGGTQPYTYYWNNAQTTSAATGLAGGNYTLTITDAKSCTATQTVNITNNLPPAPSICLVTVDSVLSNKNMIVWEKPVTGAIDSFMIYRNISAVMTRIGARPYSALSIYVDTTNGVNPKVQAYEYAISILDTCGNESALSPHHITIHMVTPAFTPPTTFDLQWSDYQGFSFTDYEIWRDGNNNGNWIKIGTVLYTLSNQYTDLTAPSDSARYRVVAVPSQPCVATIKKGPDPMATSVKSSKSNSSEKIIGPTSTNEFSIEALISVAPNPSSGIFSVFNAKYIISRISIYSYLGEEVYQKDINAKKAEITIPYIAKGVYHLQVVTPSGIVNRKIVISK
jgi:uncharacterized repeat protein (TIGR03803 family)